MNKFNCSKNKNYKANKFLIKFKVIYMKYIKKIKI